MLTKVFKSTYFDLKEQVIKNINLYSFASIIIILAMSYFVLNDSLSQRVISLVTYDSKMSAYEMEKSITNVIEDKLKNNKNVLEMQSESYNHYSVIKLFYDKSINLDNQILQLKKSLVNSLPSIDKTYYKYDLIQKPSLIIEMSLSGDMSDSEKK